MTAGRMTERMLHLRQVPVGAQLPSPVLGAVAAHMREREVAPGERIVTSGRPAESFFLLTEGAAELRRGKVAIAEVRAPRTLGLSWVLARRRAPFDAIARSRVRALEIESDVFRELLEDHFELLTATIRYLADGITAQRHGLPGEALGLPPVAMGPIPPGPLDVVTRVLLLSKISAFASANINALATFALQMQEVRVPAGHVFWSSGEPAEGALFVFQGDVTARTADGRSFRHGPGTAVGGLEALAGRPRWYGLRAETPVVGLVSRTDLLLDIFENQLGLAMDFAAALARVQIGLVARSAALTRHVARPLDTARDLA